MNPTKSRTDPFADPVVGWRTDRLRSASWPQNGKTGMTGMTSVADVASRTRLVGAPDVRSIARAGRTIPADEADPGSAVKVPTIFLAIAS